ncbi:uncharacterized protein DUF4012 [Agromyces ramosus]|uniref:Uncharacterized protein DUF4012 n=1 Tax=Agromyces ramosus TaxID=33879 RepID=A0A4Q7MIA3_9MICO|nr:DUF4012 domain-containing protein [Agromyces ramosus]RZS68065.1 uncharacterized protein DUF4012 [Agromyces ramosus]
MTQSEPFGATEPEDTRSSPERKRRRRRIAHAIVWPVVAIILIGGGFAAWTLYDSAMSVRADLEEARTEVAAFQQAATERQLDQLQPIADRLAASAERAVEPTAQPLWRAAELVPVIGENFRAVRVIAEGVDEVSTEIVNPAVGLVGSFGLQRDPATGGFDLAPLTQATEIVATADRVVTDLHEEVQAIDTDATIGQVSEAVGQFDEMLGTAEETIPQIRGALAGIGALLGVDGPKNVVLAFLNNAEANPLGGTAAAQTLLHVENGSVTIQRQVSSADFVSELGPVPVGIDGSTMELYQPTTILNMNSATSPPDFPLAAKLISAHWERTFQVKPDVIVSLDPIGLSRMLQVTGPVTMPNGEVLDSGNVVSKLLNEAYFRYPEGGAESDAYFASAASAIFDRIMSLDYDVFAMAPALVDIANNGSLMLWSADEGTQALFAGTRLQGTLPTGNDGATVLGVFFRDITISKIDYYLHSEAIVTTNTCTPDAPTYTVEVRLRFDTPDGVELPPYMFSRMFPTFRTEVFLYGPFGGTTTGVEVLDGTDVSPGPSVVDLGRPAVKFTASQLDDEVTAMRATFSGTPDDGPVEVRTTPMINPTTVTITEAPCS